MVQSIQTIERIRVGIKIAAASLLALFLSIYFRLQMPAWSVLSVLVLMTSKYIGDLAEKSLLRLVGTIIGGTVAVWLVQDYQQSPLIFIPAAAALVGYCAYRFGGTQFPYGWYLCGFTIVVISSDAIFAPNTAWQTALARIEEIFVGLLSSLIVSSILWPKYARVDFQNAVQQQIQDIARLLTNLLDINSASAPENARLAETIEDRLALLRSYMQFGNRESVYFRAHLDTYAAMISCLASLQQAGRELARQTESIRNLQIHFSAELTSLFQALREEIKNLTNCDIKVTNKVSSNLQEALQRLDKAIIDFREEKKALQYDAITFTGFASYYVSLRQIAFFADQLRELITHSKFSNLALTRTRTPAKAIHPKIDPTWIRVGIKSAISFSLALLFFNWTKPTNGFVIPIFATLFTIQTPRFYGGKGDQEVFQSAIKASLIGIPLFLGYYAISPALSHYALMNFFLFCYIALFGYWIAPKMPTLSYGQLAMAFITVPLIVMNPQQRVGAETMITFFLATFTGLFFASIIQRTVLPILPQYELRNRVCQFFNLFSRIQKQGHAASEMELYSLVTLPNEIKSWMKGLKAPVFDQSEKNRLQEFAELLERLGHQIKCLDYKIPDQLPNEVRSLANSTHAEFNTMAENVAQAVRVAFQTGSPPDTSAPRHATDACNHLFTELRAHHLPLPLDNLSALQFLSHYNRLSYTTQLAAECLAQLGQLKLREYSRDTSL